MILIADSGSTKTSWFFFKDSNHSEKISTNGINPFFRTTESIVAELQKELIPKTGTSVSEIFFYGAGIIDSKKAQTIKDALQQLFATAKIEVESDLLAAARATFQYEKGIACILGTGANTCLYNGQQIIDHVPPLGFILGDEGSGAVLGRKLVADYLKGIMPDDLSQKFSNQFQLNYTGFLESVYKKERPNKFLAQFTPFLYNNINNDYCVNLVIDSFKNFIERNIKLYSGYQDETIRFVGSVAYYFQPQLKEAMQLTGLNYGGVLKEPLDGLKKFHLQ